MKKLFLALALSAAAYYYYGAFDLRNGPEAGRCGGREGW